MIERRPLLMDAGAFLNAIDEAIMNTKPKMTPWFSPEVKPVRVGEYNASQSKSPDVRRWWNGKRWSPPYTNATPEADKLKTRKKASIHTGFPWRGLAEPYGLINGELVRGANQASWDDHSRFGAYRG